MVLAVLGPALGAAPAGASGPVVRVSIRPAFENVPLDATASFSYRSGSTSCSSDHRSAEAPISKLPSPLLLFEAVGSRSCAEGVTNATYQLTIVQPDGEATTTALVVSSELLHRGQWVFRVQCPAGPTGGPGALTCQSQSVTVSPAGHQDPVVPVTFVS